MFAHQPQNNDEAETKSLRIGGHCTSIRLENVFWTILEQMAAREGTSLAKVVTRLHDGVLEHHGALNNLASLLRCSCLIHVLRTAGCFAGDPCAAPLLAAADQAAGPRSSTRPARQFEPSPAAALGSATSRQGAPADGMDAPQRQCRPLR